MSFKKDNNLYSLFAAAKYESNEGATILIKEKPHYFFKRQIIIKKNKNIITNNRQQ